MVPRTAALALLAASLGSCAPQPSTVQAQSGAPLSPGPRFVPLTMSATSTPGLSGTCYLENRTVVFAFRGLSGPNRLCSASCAFIDGNGAVQTAHTGRDGVRPAAAADAQDFAAPADHSGPTATAAVRLVEKSGLGNCQVLF